MAVVKRGPKLIKLTQRKLADNFVKQMLLLCATPIESMEPLNGLGRLSDRLHEVLMDSLDDRKTDGSIEMSHARKLLEVSAAARGLISAIQRCRT